MTPGLAYSTVPRWNTGDERKGGTSMASPHAAGLAALLLSGLIAGEGRTIDARQIRQALMVTARPARRRHAISTTAPASPTSAAAWRWLVAGSAPSPTIAVRALRSRRDRRVSRSAASATPATPLQTFDVDLPAGTPARPT